MKKSPVTEAHRVATDIAAIKSALQQQGYTTRKRPKQAAWTIIPLNQRGTGRNFQANNPTGSYQIVFDVTPTVNHQIPQTPHNPCLDEGRVLPLKLSVDTKIKRLNPPLQLTCHGISLPIAIANSSY